MKSTGKYFLLVIINILFFSCQSAKEKELITGGNYKFWIFKNHRGVSTFIEYFDKNGKCLSFVKVLNGGFEKYDWGDKIFLYCNECWDIPKPGLLHWRNENLNILELTDSIFVVSNQYHTDTLIKAPDILIPIKYRQLQ